MAKRKKKNKQFEEIKQTSKNSLGMAIGMIITWTSIVLLLPYITGFYQRVSDALSLPDWLWAVFLFMGVFVGVMIYWASSKS